MTGSIIAVFEACAAAVGTPFQRPQRGTTTRCPLHDDRTASLSLREDRGTFRCFSASCIASSKSADLPGHGIVDAPIAFGLAKTRSDAARWLADRGLIPEADGTKGTAPREAFQPCRFYTDHERLPLLSRGFRTQALCDLSDAVGFVRYRAARDFIAEWRYQRAIEIGCGCELRMYAALLCAANEVNSNPVNDGVPATNRIVERARWIAPSAFACVEARRNGTKPERPDYCVEAS